jgi:hypothetical protein
MPNEALSAAIADLHAEIDEVTEDTAPKYGSRIAELLAKPKERDLAAWKAWGVDARLFEMTPASIEKASNGERDDLWFFAMGGLRAACIKQAFVELVAPGLLKAAESGREAVNREASKMDRVELSEHAKIGTPKSEFAAAKERLKNAKAAKG